MFEMGITKRIINEADIFQAVVSDNLELLKLHLEFFMPSFTIPTFGRYGESISHVAIRTKARRVFSHLVSEILLFYL